MSDFGLSAFWSPVNYLSARYLNELRRSILLAQKSTILIFAQLGLALMAEALFGGSQHENSYK